jgi:ABC-type nitrate/sulfonate/bicarbonate transport system permease component
MKTPRAQRIIQGLDLLSLAGMAVVIAVWWALSLVVPSSFLPAPARVAERVVADFLSAPELVAYGLPEDTSLLNSMIYTAENVFIAVFFGGLIGTLSGLASARLRALRAVVDPIALTIGTIPILVAAPFFLIWFGTGRISAVALVMFYVIVTLYIFAQRAADNLDPVYEEAARTFGAGEWRIIGDILVPGTVPQILGGLRIALAGAWGLEAISELLGADRGMGKIISMLGFTSDVEGIFATLAILGVFAVASDALLGFAITRLTGWSVSARVGGRG